MFRIIITAVVVLFVAATVPLSAQGGRAAVALSYEQSGDYRSAARLWQSLYDEDPKSEEYFGGVCRTLKALDNMQSLKDIVEKRLLTIRSVSTLTVYGQLQWNSGKEDDADKAWSEALKKSAVTERSFLEMAKAQIEVRAVAKAIETLERGRTALRKPEVFADDLAKLYATNGNITRSLEQVLLVFDRSSQLQYAQGRISALMTDDSAARIVQSLMKKEYDSRGSENIAFARLYEWFLRESKKPDEACAIVEDIDKRLNARGRELVNFAETMRADGNYETAMRAFSAVMAMGKSSDVAQYAAFGFAACSESQSGDNASPERSAEVVKLYRTIIRDYPRSSSAADAHLRIGSILERSGAASEEVKKEYRTVVRSYEAFPQAAIAMLALAKVSMADDSLDAAMNLLGEALSMRGATQELMDEVQFQRGEILFFKGYMDSALSVYTTLAEQPESNFANDAIERMSIIRQCADDSLMLWNFAQAGRLRNRRRIDESLKLYDEIMLQRRNPDIAELACIKAAELCMGERRYAPARAYCEKLSTQWPESIYLDRAMVLSARSFRAEGNKAESKAQYEELLRSFPRSIFTQEARAALRQKDLQP
ncbi:MAG: tetratricopeptide repeat protein [Candidatus Kapaibacterium sp.]